MFFIFYDRVQIKIKKGYYIFRLLPKLKGTEQREERLREMREVAVIFVLVDGIKRKKG